MNLIADWLWPARHQPVVLIPAAFIFLALVFYGSHAMQAVLVGCAFAITFVAFTVTLSVILRFLSAWLEVGLSIVVAICAAVLAARTISSGAGTVPLFGFVLGAVVAELADSAGARFSDAVLDRPIVGDICARVCFGILGAYAAIMAPPHVVAASTALCGARGFTACTDALTGRLKTGLFDMLITLALAVAGYVTQVCFISPREGTNPDDACYNQATLPYQTIR